MGVQSCSLNTSIKPLALSFVRGDEETKVVNRFVAICHKMATRYITMKANSPSWYQHIQTESINDLAWDSIADIFQKDESGRFTCLVDYYQSLDLEHMTEGELYSATRRLVFSKVNDSLFRLMREYDPSLSKIIRNVKRAVKDNPNIFLIRKWGDPYLVFDTNAPADFSLSGWIAPEMLLSRLSPSLTAKENLPDILRFVRRIIISQNEYVHAYPLVALCMIIREAHACIQDTAPCTVLPSYAFMKQDVSEIIRSSINAIKTGMRSYYVKSGKIDDQTFEHYFDGIRDYCIDNYVFYVEGIPYFTYIRRYLPELTYSLYRTYHRKYVEYLMRLSKGHIHRQLKKII